jgi:hypothetical protein
MKIENEKEPYRQLDFACSGDGDRRAGLHRVSRSRRTRRRTFARPEFCVGKAQHRSFDIGPEGKSERDFELDARIDWSDRVHGRRHSRSRPKVEP